MNPWQAGWIGAALGIVSTTAALGQSDRIDLAQLGERGVAFETVGKGSRAVKSCAGVGDFNGDGLSDLAIIGFVANSFDRPPYVPSNVYVVYGRPALTGQHKLDASLPGVLALGTLDYEQTRLDPTAVYPIGDIDHDGLDDLHLPFSSQYPPGPGLSPGFSLILYGSRALSGERLLDEIGEGGIRGTHFVSREPSVLAPGYAAASAGDLNGDGSPDLALSAAMPTAERRNLAIILFQTSDLSATVDVGAVGTTIPGVVIRLVRYGEVHATAAGDVNGDGHDDLLIGSYPLVFLVYGRSSFLPILDLASAGLGPDESVLRDLGAVAIVGPANQERLEFAGKGQMAGVGDLDQDGYDDFLVGAAYAGIFVPGEVPRKQSAAYLFYGGPSLSARLSFEAMPPGVARRITSGEEESFGTWFARAVAGAGDVDGDGQPDLAIGEPKATVKGRANAGAVHVLHGGQRSTEDLVLPGGASGMLIQGEASSDFLGTYVSPAGDFNGDGAQDLLVAAPVNGGADQSGRAYVIHGGGGRGAPLTVLGLNPAAGSLRGGTRVRLSGSGFAPGLKVTFGTVEARSVSVLSSTEAVAETPPGPSPQAVPVEVELNGERRRLAEPFHYVAVHPDIDLAGPGRHGLRVDGSIGSELGHSLGLAEVTGDGAADLLIASLLGEEWVLSIVRGGSDLPESLQAFETSGRVSLIRGPLPSGRRRSVDVSGLGDIDGDGIDDLGIGTSQGLAAILFGTRQLDADIDIESAIGGGQGVRLETPFLSYGRFSFAPLGDLDGDELDDVALGLSAGFSSDPVPGGGQIVLVRGRRSWPPPSVDLTDDANVLTRITSGDPEFAREVAVLGDVDGDSRPELLGSQARVEADRKLVYLFRGGAIISPEPRLEERIAAGGAIVLGVPRGTSSTPLHVAAPGDVNGDGFADILIADETGGVLNQGVTYLIHGRPDLPAQIALEDPGFPVVRILGPGNLVQSGRAFGPAGDFTGDGFADFIIGAQNPDPFSPGTLSITYGGPEPPATLDLRRLGPHGLTLRGIQPITLLQTSTHQPGDFNADGRPDFAFAEMGSPDFYREVVPSPGAVHVVFGLPESYRFVRGDATFDGEINISDAIYILTYLFVGSLGPECEDAADADDDGELLITDAIYLLSSLFLGGPTPGAPYPGEGLDPTEDRLGCRGY